jgi:hypothetical protein
MEQDINMGLCKSSDTVEDDEYDDEEEDESNADILWAWRVSRVVHVALKSM